MTQKKVTFICHIIEDRTTQEGLNSVYIRHSFHRLQFLR